MQTEYKDNIKLLRMTFDDALEHFSDMSIDLLYIDWTHTYEAVKYDFESWLPKMSSKGVVMLHDTQVKDENFGIWRLWKEISGLYPSWEIDFASGLGILAVGKDVNEECITFLSEASINNFYRDLFFNLGGRLRMEETLGSIHRSRG